MPALSRLLLLFAVAAGRVAALTLTGPDASLELTAADLAALPHATANSVDSHAGATHRYAGVSVRLLLEKLQAPLGEKLRGPALQLVVVVHGTDGYAAVFALADFDPAFRADDILLADRDDTGPLAAPSGPLRLVVPGDRRAARSVRGVTAVELRAVGPLTPHPAHPASP